MGRTFFTQQESPANAVDVGPDKTSVAIAGRNIFKVFTVDDSAGFIEKLNLRSGRNLNLNYSCIDVAWNQHDENQLASAATNGAVVLWNISRGPKTRQEHVFNDHRRTVNKVNFHPLDPKLLISGAQDGTANLYDVRTVTRVMTFASPNIQDCVRDVQFSPNSHPTLAMVAENGRVSIWDMRRAERSEKVWQAHSEYALVCDWHPEIRNYIATGGRDKSIKIWRIADKPVLDITIHTLGPVNNIKWRPERRAHIASSAMALENSVNVWDIRRPFAPYALFEEHRDVTTGVVWRGDPYAILSTSRDGTLYHHDFADAKRPTELANPNGLAVSTLGEVSFAYRDNSLATVWSSPCTALDAAEPNEVVAAAGAVSLAAAAKSGLGPLAGLDSESQPIVPLPPPPPPLPASQQATAATTPRNSFVSRMSPVDVMRKTSCQNDFFRSFKSHLRLHSICNTADAYASTNNEPVVEEAGESACASPTLVISEAKQVEAFTDTDWIRFLAKSYLLSGKSFSALCDHNSQVALSIEREQTATSWITLKSLLGGFDFERSVRTAASLDPRQASGTGEKGGDSSAPGELRSRHISMSARVRSQSGRAASGAGPDAGLASNGAVNGSASAAAVDASPAAASAAVTNRRNVEIDADSEDDDYEDNEKTLTNIASGQMLATYYSGDLFGDNDVTPIRLDQFVYPNVGSFMNLDHDWNIRPEAFEFRHEINEATTHDEATVENFYQNGMQSPEERPSRSVTMEDHVTTLLTVKNISVLPSWSPDAILKETLEYFAESGDVQSSVVMYIVIGHERLKHLFDDSTIEYWFGSYIDLLHRLQLYNEATKIIQLGPIAAVSTMNSHDTTYYSNCASCQKALNRSQGGWLCDRCKSFPARCSICHKNVKGLYAWCQGCAHGGHPAHITAWFSNHRLCPAGCGHYCEYQ